jgi:hypothetical protein
VLLCRLHDETIDTDTPTITAARGHCIAVNRLIAPLLFSLAIPAQGLLGQKKDNYVGRLPEGVWLLGDRRRFSVLEKGGRSDLVSRG